MGITIGFVGTGQFASDFLPLFKLHPGVDAVYATDLVPERSERAVRELGADKAFGSYEELLGSDCDAIAVFTQRWTRGPLTLQALELTFRMSRGPFTSPSPRLARPDGSRRRPAAPAAP